MNTTGTKRSRQRLDPDTFTDPHMREVADWHVLMTDAETLTALTGWELPDVWELIRAGAFQAAAARMLERADTWAQIHQGSR